MVVPSEKISRSTSSSLLPRVVLDAMKSAGECLFRVTRQYVLNSEFKRGSSFSCGSASSNPARVERCVTFRRTEPPNSNASIPSSARSYSRYGMSMRAGRMIFKRRVRAIGLRRCHFDMGNSLK